MTYKWQLRKGSKKDVCPACGQRRFVPYVLAADGITLAGAEYGRCDREQSCGYHRYPNGEKVVACEMPKIEPKEMLRYVGKMNDTPPADFHLFLAETLTFTDALVAINDYHIDGVDGKVIWWQIDRDGMVRTGKVMKYLPNGHRDKTDTYPVTWAHKYSKLKRDFKGEELQQCLFGEHLLARYPDKPVCVVESEKTAVIMSRIYPTHIWLATGGSQGIKSNERLAPLIGRKVLLIPDNGQYWNWLRVAQQYGWLCYEGLEKDTPFEGADILDVIELAREFENKQQTKDLIL